MSRKIERLINLTIALLATKRYLTKSEIFESVEGYEGSPQTKERMFERDKDDLRSLGIEIEVGSFDPLFNDEAGYRIKQERYQFNLGEITPIEISLLSLAAEAWQQASFGENADKALVKLNSLGVPGDISQIPGTLHKLHDGGQDLALISRAIASTMVLHFNYLDLEMNSIAREIVPISLSTRAGHWYLAGVDQEIEEIRSFRLDRILGDITASEGPKDFEIPEDFDPHNSLSSVQTNDYALIDVRVGKGSNLRAIATSTRSLGEWDELKIPIYNLESLSAMILWHGMDAIVREPKELREFVIQELQSLVANHE